jgi:hypothetical protein
LNKIEHFETASFDCNLQVLEEDVKVKDWELNGNPEAIIRA